MNLAYKKILGKFTKVLGFGKTPPPHVGKNSQIKSFFSFWKRTLKAMHKRHIFFLGPFSLLVTYWILICMNYYLPNHVRLLCIGIWSSPWNADKTKMGSCGYDFCLGNIRGVHSHTHNYLTTKWLTGCGSIFRTPFFGSWKCRMHHKEYQKAICFLKQRYSRLWNFWV